MSSSTATGLPELSRAFLESFKKSDFASTAKLLPQVKVAMAKAGVLIPRPDVPQQDLIAARQILELGVFAAIHVRDDDEVNRLITLVRSFYSPKLGLPTSANQNKIVALYLLLLVANNEIAEFHTELDCLENSSDDADTSQIHTDPFLSYPVHLEQWLMEGLYDKVWKAITDESQFPSAEFAILAETLVSTVRSEIAMCTEKAYTSLPIGNARHLLFLSSDQEIIDYVKTEQPRWVLKSGRIYFPSSAVDEDESMAVDDEEHGVKLSTSEALIDHALQYAIQIETII